MTDSLRRNGEKGCSVLEELNAAVKLLCLVLTAAAVTVCKSVLGFACAAAVVTAEVYISPLSLKAVIASVKRLVGFLLLVVIMNAVFHSPDNAFAHWWIFTPSVIGALVGIAAAFKTVLVMAAFEVFISCTELNELSDALSFILSPLRFIGIPVVRVAAVISESVRTVSALLLFSGEIKAHELTYGINFGVKKRFAGHLTELTVCALRNARQRAEYLDCALTGLEPKVCPYFSDGIRRFGMTDLYAFLVCASFWAMEVVVL